MKKSIHIIIYLLACIILLFFLVNINKDNVETNSMNQENITKATVDISKTSISKEEFNRENIHVDKLPQKEYVYNSSEESMNYDKNYVRLDKIVSDEIKIYAVGDWDKKIVLIVYKDEFFYTDWETDPGEELNECMLYDFDLDGEDELAVCTHSDVHHDNLYIVELSNEKLWQYKELNSYDKQIDSYIWNQLSFSYKEVENSIVFTSENGINEIKYSEESFPNSKEFLQKNIQMETLNNRRIIMGGHIYHEEDGAFMNIPLFSESETPNFLEYKLKHGDLIMCVSVDCTQGMNYGEAYLKLNYTEDGIVFSKFDFLNSCDEL